ncbi:SMI1/KNR4 family protein [Streptomyces sp. TLI_171]|uniref:SMI1/KNR4 family protein n=1 Tax=Streptomyces sp. TLI_171 TaxID=1938859 RepID=UPI000C3F0C07|nr:SMI1/KNR4 family protein [Streptomyces sp. TLI_171]RKE18896.1 hypothetical protein BX266_2192 [Streptomyces sp. TLI_171]
MTAVDWASVRTRVSTLAAHDPDGPCPVSPPLAEERVAEAEGRLGFTFPAEYRAYLRQVSAGGWFVDELRCTERGWGWRSPVAPVPGLAFLAARGEGCAVGLAVAGPARGTMWMDNRALHPEPWPLLTEDGRPATFGEWLVDWLDHREPLIGATREQHGQVMYCWLMGVETPIDWCPPPTGR